MLSFLIPSYNYNCIQLVSAICKQAMELKEKLDGTFDFEILLADDGSTDNRIIEQNRVVETWPGCRYLRLESNVGRACIRNFLVKESRFDYLVLMDCDALVCTSNFVETYWMLRDSAEVVCGSLKNLDVCPNGGELRYFYEKDAEKRRTVEFRQAHPYKSFTTFNILFHRSVFERVQFDERCVEYGYEDALMGVIMERLGISIKHIDNPLIHNGIESSLVYLRKLETSLRVLSRLGEPMHSASPLVQLVRKINAFRLLPLVRFCLRCFRESFRKNLLSRSPSLLILKLYKLGYYVCYIHQHS